jgi:hypothetical protein
MMSRAWSFVVAGGMVLGSSIGLGAGAPPSPAPPAGSIFAEAVEFEKEKLKELEKEKQKEEEIIQARFCLKEKLANLHANDSSCETCPDCQAGRCCRHHLRDLLPHRRTCDQPAAECCTPERHHPLRACIASRPLRGRVKCLIGRCRDRLHPLREWLSYRPSERGLCGCRLQWVPCCDAPLYTYFMPQGCCAEPSVQKASCCDHAIGQSTPASSMPSDATTTTANGGRLKKLILLGRNRGASDNGEAPAIAADSTVKIEKSDKK